MPPAATDLAANKEIIDVSLHLACWLLSPWPGGGLSSTAIYSTDREEPETTEAHHSGPAPRQSAQGGVALGLHPLGQNALQGLVGWQGLRSARGPHVCLPTCPPALSRGRPTALPSVRWHSACALVNVECSKFSKPGLESQPAMDPWVGVGGNVPCSRPWH